MTINAVNSVSPSFSGTKLTSKGNKYEDSNIGKFGGFLVGAGCGAYFIKQKFIKSSKLTTPKVAIAGAAILILGLIGKTIGNIVDGAINIHRRSSANQEAKQQETKK